MTEAIGRVLVLGGFSSGESAYAERLLAGVPRVTCLAVRPASGDRTWAAKVTARANRQPAHWAIEEVDTDLTSWFEYDSALLVDNVDSWLRAHLETLGAQESPDIDPLVAAVEKRGGPLVLISAEVGLTVMPATGTGRRFAEALGLLNQRLAAVCDAVVLVVAGTPLWLKGGPDGGDTPPRRARVTGTPGTRRHETDTPVPYVALDPTLLSVPDDDAREASRERMATLDVAGAGLGRLADQVTTTAAYRGTATPSPYTDIRLILFNSTGDDRPALGQGCYPLLTDRSAARLDIVEITPDDADPVHSDVLTTDAVDAAIGRGRALADTAVDAGADLLVLGSLSGDTPRTAALVALLTGAEPAAMLARVVTSDGRVDDNEWMSRCAAVRDMLRRVRAGKRDPRSLLGMLGGTELAVATGLILGATARRTPIVLDGPVGITAALLARDLAGQSRYWLMLLDHGGHPAVKMGAEVLGLSPVLDLGLDLGEGANALMTLPLVQTVLATAAELTTDTP